MTAAAGPGTRPRGWRGASDRHGWVMRPADVAQLLTAGTLLVEATVPPFPETPICLLDYVRTDGWPRAVSLLLEPSGRLHLSVRQGPATVEAELQVPLAETEMCLRVFYCWDAPARQGWLGIELPCLGLWRRVPVAAPHPVPEEDLALLSCPGDPARAGRVSPGHSLLAWSDRIEPIGPMPGLAAGTPVETAAGMRRIEDIAPGDLVRTSASGFQPVRHAVRRTVPAGGMFAPVLLAAPGLGLGADVLVSPMHRMLIDGGDAEYLFGADAVLVEARHLLPLAAAPLADAPATVRYHQLILDRHQCLSIAGAWGESLYLGALARRPRMRAGTVLAPFRDAELPLHAHRANPMLEAYEAVVLVDAIGA